MSKSSKIVFYYYEIDIPQEVIEAHRPTGGMMNGASILKAKRREYISKTNSKNAKIIEDFVFACSAFYGFNGTRSALCLEYINERDWERHQEAVKELKDYFLNEYGIKYVFELKRKLDITTMRERDESSDEPDMYWKTKVYFNETLPASRGFDTTCGLLEYDGDLSWIDYWVRDR